MCLLCQSLLRTVLSILLFIVLSLTYIYILDREDMYVQKIKILCSKDNDVDSINRKMESSKLDMIGNYIYMNNEYLESIISDTMLSDNLIEDIRIRRIYPSMVEIKIINKKILYLSNGNRLIGYNGIINRRIEEISNIRNIPIIYSKDDQKDDYLIRNFINISNIFNNSKVTLLGIDIRERYLLKISFTYSKKTINIIVENNIDKYDKIRRSLVLLVNRVINTDDIYGDSIFDLRYKYGFVVTKQT